MIERFFKGESKNVEALTFSDRSLSVSDINSLISKQPQALDYGYEHLIHVMSAFGSGSSAIDLIDDRKLYTPDLLVGSNTRKRNNGLHCTPSKAHPGTQDVGQ